MLEVLHSNLKSFSFKLKNTSGVYFLKRNGVVIYVGKSINVFHRIFGTDHCDKLFDEIEIYWLPVNKILAFEKASIIRLRPDFNKIKRSKPKPFSYTLNRKVE